MEKELSKAGLQKTEISVYLYLLEHGLATPAQIGKGISMLRPNTYAILKSLEEKNLIDKEPRGKRFVYHAKDPEAIILRLESQKQAMRILLPDLRALYKAQKNKPIVKFYYGADEVKEVFARTDGATEILFVITTESFFETHPEFFKKLRTKIFQEKIFVRDILTQQSGVNIAEKSRETMRGYYDFRLFPKKHSDLPTTIRIWNDTVALIMLEDPIMATVLQSAPLAQTFRVMFETMWSAGERPPRS